MLYSCLFVDVWWLFVCLLVGSSFVYLLFVSGSLGFWAKELKGVFVGMFMHVFNVFGVSFLCVYV